MVMKKLLSEGKTLILPGAYDCFSVKIIEKMGFDAAYLTGYGAEASVLGRPDMGFTTMNDVCDLARRMCTTVDLPIIVDADLGWGGTLSITRTIQEFENAGVAGLHIEDQAIPLKCAGMPGLKFISCEEMCMRIRAAVSARNDPDFLIIGRCDTFAKEGFDGTKERLHAYMDAGADYLIAGGGFNEDQLWDLSREFPHKMCWNAGLSVWPESMLPISRFNEMSAAMMFFALVGLAAAGKAIEDTYSRLKMDTLTPEYIKENTMDMRRMEATLDYAKYIEIEKKFSLD